MDRSTLSYMDAMHIHIYPLSEVPIMVEVFCDCDVDCFTGSTLPVDVATNAMSEASFGAKVLVNIRRTGMEPAGSEGQVGKLIYDSRSFLVATLLATLIEHYRYVLSTTADFASFFFPGAVPILCQPP